MHDSLVARLRQRFFVCKRLRTISDIATEIQLDRQTLTRFANGEGIHSRNLELIAAWIEAEEQRASLAATH